MFIKEFKHKLKPWLQDQLNSEVELSTLISTLVKLCLSIYLWMPAIDKIKDKNKSTEITPILAFIKSVVILYQR